jgi:hypothetical protein
MEIIFHKTADALNKTIILSNSKGYMSRNADEFASTEIGWTKNILIFLWSEHQKRIIIALLC